MDHIAFLIDVFQQQAARPALVWRGRALSYEDLGRRVFRWREELDRCGVRPGAVVALEGDFSPDVIAAMIALIGIRAIVAPLTLSGRVSRPRRLAVASIQAVLTSEKGDPAFECARGSGSHELYERLRRTDHPGLVLFTSGSTGEPKAAVHDFPALLERFQVRRPAFTALAFLLFDHWGGLNTMFHTLSNGGTLVTVEERTPEHVCDLIERHRIELLPTSPTFLNLLLLSGAYKTRDLSSLKVVSYGTEPMPEATLCRLAAVFPHVKLHQTYGLIELGVLRSKSRDNGSLWVKLGGEGYETRVRNGILEIKARSAMLGYLNAPSPFTKDGWFVTGDAVEVDGDYYRIRGRTSELINVGGEKVYPAEVESVIHELDNVAQVTVYGEPNAITGNVVCASVQLRTAEAQAAFAARLKAHCRTALLPFQVPVRVVIEQQGGVTERFKKMRWR